MKDITIDLLTKFVKDEKIRWTNHVITRIFQRNISEEDILNTIINGEIIENYEDSYPYPSCLIYGYDLDGNILHVVCGITDEEIWIVTAYYPNNFEWEDDLKTRRESK